MDPEIDRTQGLRGPQTATPTGEGWRRVNDVPWWHAPVGKSRYVDHHFHNSLAPTDQAAAALYPR